MRYVITKSGNYGIITPIPQGILSATLDKYLQYTRKGQQFMAHPEWAIVRFWKPKTGRFPWGLLNKVCVIMEKYCNVKGEEFIVEGNKQRQLECKVQHEAYLNEPLGTLRPYQKEAVHKLIEARGGVLCMPTASGKTITIIEYLKFMNLRTLVIVPTIDIRKQWNDYGLPNVTVSTYQNPKLKLKGAMEIYQIIVMDECHHTASKTIYTHAMNTNTHAFLVGVSATPTRDDGEDMRVFAALGPIVYNITRKQLIEEGYLANALVTYLKPTFETSGKYMDYQKVYDLEIVKNPHRNFLIYRTALEETQNKRKILILVSTIEHGEILLKLFELLFDKLNIIFMNGQSKDRDQDMTKFDIIIATSIYDEGYNLPSLDTLILAAGGRSSIKLTQRIGRVLRQKADGRFAHVYDFIDTPKYLKAQYLARRAILEKDFEIIEQNEQKTLMEII